MLKTNHALVLLGLEEIHRSYSSISECCVHKQYTIVTEPEAQPNEIKGVTAFAIALFKNKSLKNLYLATR